MAYFIYFIGLLSGINALSLLLASLPTCPESGANQYFALSNDVTYSSSAPLVPHRKVNATFDLSNDDNTSTPKCFFWASDNPDDWFECPSDGRREVVVDRHALLDGFLTFNQTWQCQTNGQVYVLTNENFCSVYERKPIANTSTFAVRRRPHRQCMLWETQMFV